MESRTALEIERVAYDEFLVQWSQGVFAQQRLGQAFYNFFYLHKLADQSVLRNLYEADGKKAIALIAQYFEIR